MIGLVKKDEFEAELNQLNGEQRAEVVDMPTRGRKEGDNNVPDFLRKIIGENAIEEGNKETKTLTRAFGISDSSMTAYKNGATSTASYNEPQPELKGKMNDTKTRIAGKAKSRILRAISNITDEKLQDTKPVDLSAIARNLSAVVKQMEPEAQQNQKNGPTFVFYTPPQKKEESYDVIVLKE